MLGKPLKRINPWYFGVVSTLNVHKHKDFIGISGDHSFIFLYLNIEHLMAFFKSVCLTNNYIY
jgi:hypothetical protein